MKKLFITVGVSGSGKSTWAEEFVKNNPGTVNINRDDIRFKYIQPNGSWKTYEFTRENEAKVTEISRQLMLEAMAESKTIICSDTNLNPYFRNKLIEFAKKHDYSYEIIEFNISLKDAINRDYARENGVGHDVIINQYEKWKEYTGEYA